MLNLFLVILSWQVCGAYPDTMTRCAQLINDIMEVDFVDINCGCPIDLIFKKVVVLSGYKAKIRNTCV